MDPSVEKVLGLPELRETILELLLFKETGELKISNVITFRLVCKSWLKTVNHCIHQNLRNDKNPFQDHVRYAPVIVKIRRLPQFLQLLENDCLKSNPALPFKLLITCSNNYLTKYHKELESLLSNYSQGLVIISINKHCNLPNFSLPNLHVITANVSSVDTSKRLETIQKLLDASQDSFTKERAQKLREVLKFDANYIFLVPNELIQLFAT